MVFMPGMEDGLFPSHRSIDSEEKMEEERRLCYVGMTRAKERLFLTSAEYRVTYGQGNFTRESAFMRELDPALLDGSGDMVYVPKKGSGIGLGIDTGHMDGFSEPVHKPYDPLRYAKKVVESKTSKGDQTFSAGDEVEHSKFGTGLVIEEDDKTVTVMFDSVGRKKLAKGIAQLKKL